MGKKISSLFYIILNIVAGLLIFFLPYYFSDIAYRFAEGTAASILSYAIDTGSEFLCLYLYLKYVLKCRFQDIYIRKSGPKPFWCLIALACAAVIYAFYFLFVPGHFKMNPYPLSQQIHLLTVSILGYGIIAGITQEAVFRGFILRSCQKIYGTRVSILVSSALFTVLHIPFFQEGTDWRNFLLLLLLFMLGSLVLALLTIQTGSIWTAAFIHAIYNIFPGGDTLLFIGKDQNWPSVFSYILTERPWPISDHPKSDQMVTVVPCMIGFAVMAILVLAVQKKSHKITEEGMLQNE